MKVISSTFLPFKGFTAINLFGIIVVHKKYLPIISRIINHKVIHSHKRIAYLLDIEADFIIATSNKLIV